MEQLTKLSNGLKVQWQGKIHTIGEDMPLEIAMDLFRIQELKIIYNQ